MGRAAWVWDRVSDGYFRPVVPAPQIPSPATWRDDRLTVAWLGHSTLLINFFGLWLIADPALLKRVGVRAGPVTLGPKRVVAPALRASQLPPLDFILLTHAHMDHFDLGTLRKLSRRATVITATSTADLLPRRFRDVVELGWNETQTFERPRGSLTVEAFGVRHWGARIRTDTHRGFNGYIVERHGRRLCLAGDTARTDMRAIGRRGPIDVMAVPIGAYNPWIKSHCTPEQAVAMANEARARFVIPVHHQTFRLGREPMDEPIRRFRRALEPDRIALTEVGETFELET
jgi:L-ascorbate metabolism protein UlaG (beta-lactamase superfamily)